MVNETPVPVPRLANERSGRTTEEPTRRITLDASVRRTSREASDSITRRVLRGSEDAPEWSPSEDLVLDVRPSLATGEISTGEVDRPAYGELIAASRGEPGTATIEVQLECMDTGLPPEEVGLVQTPPRPRPTLDDLSEEIEGEPASWEPFPELTFSVEEPPRRRTLRGAPPPRITTLGVPLPLRRAGEITGPQLPLRAPAQASTIAALLSEIETAPAPAEIAPAGAEEISVSESMVVPLPLPFNEQALRRLEPPPGKLLVPVLLGSGAAVVALGFAVAALLVANRRPAVDPVVAARGALARVAPRPGLQHQPARARRPAPAPRQSLEDLLSRAVAQEHRRDHAAAHAFFLAALRLSPEAPAAILGQARTAVELNLPGALDLLSRSSDAADRESLELLRIRRAMLAGQWRQAEVQLRRLPASQRRDVRAQLWLAEILAARGQSAAAADIYRALLRHRRPGPRALYAEAALGYSRLLVDLGLNELAVGHARRALHAAAGVPSLEAQARQLISRFQD